MTDPTNERTGFLADLTVEQVALYHQANEASAQAVAHGGPDFWTILRGLDAPAADKYAVADAMGYLTVKREYAAEMGLDPYEGKVDMTTLKRGDQFIGPDGHTRYEVTTPASEHERGWVDVRDLSMSDEEAARRAEQPDLYGPDSRGGFFAYDAPTYVQPVETTQQTVVPDQAANAERAPTKDAHEQGVADGYAGKQYNADLFADDEHGRDYRAGLREGRTAAVDEELVATFGPEPAIDPPLPAADDTNTDGWEA